MFCLQPQESGHHMRVQSAQFDRRALDAGKRQSAGIGGSGPRIPEAHPRRQGKARGNATARVLVIDDEPTVLRAFRRVLEPTYTVVLASNGRDALTLLRAGSDFDAVICDINMPVLGGVDFFRQLQLSYPDLAQRLVFCSGGAIGAATLEFIESTQNLVLHKPVSPRILLDTLAGFQSSRGSD